MSRIKLTISYDGTAYHGWQKQKHEPVTVEETVEQALSKLLGTDIDVRAASRTDAGVHALGQVAHFDAELPMPIEKLPQAANAMLPDDIRIVDAAVVSDEFHARHHTRGKLYRYTLNTAEFPDVLRRNTEHHVGCALDVGAMQRGASYLVGEHDFRSLVKNADPEADTVREIYSLNVTEDGDRVTMEVRGNGFLYNMVRAIAGTLLDVGLGKRSPEWVADMLLAETRTAAGPTLPGNGLVLVEIDYIEEYT